MPLRVQNSIRGKKKKKLRQRVRTTVFGHRLRFTYKRSSLYIKAKYAYHRAYAQYVLQIENSLEFQKFTCFHLEACVRFDVTAASTSIHIHFIALRTYTICIKKLILCQKLESPLVTNHLFVFESNGTRFFIFILTLSFVLTIVCSCIFIHIYF